MTRLHLIAFFVVMILVIISGLFNIKVQNMFHTKDCPPCHASSQVDSGPSLDQTVHLTRLAAADESIPSPVTAHDTSVDNPVNFEITKSLFSPMETYYDVDYWNFQRPLGKIGGVLEQWKFRDLIPPGSNCLDFGAGGGFLLNGLTNCTGKLGVELNPHAIAHAKTTFGITLQRSPDNIPDNWADVIISNHALEHVLCPWCELRRLRNKLKRGSGRLIFVVPAAGRNDHWTGTPDVNNHIYSITFD